MAKSTKCGYCGQSIDNRAIKAHERAHEKTGDQKLVVTPPFSERLKEAKQKVVHEIGDREHIPTLEEIEGIGRVSENQPDANENVNVPVSLEDEAIALTGKKHPATYNVERRQKIAELRAQGLGYRKIAQAMNLPIKSGPIKVRKIVKELGL